MENINPVCFRCVTFKCILFIVQLTFTKLSQLGSQRLILREISFQKCLNKLKLKVKHRGDWSYYEWSYTEFYLYLFGWLSWSWHIPSQENSCCIDFREHGNNFVRLKLLPQKSIGIGKKKEIWPFQFREVEFPLFCPWRIPVKTMEFHSLLCHCSWMENCAGIVL